MCLRNLIINLPKSDTWKIQSAIAANFIFSKDGEEKHVIHLSSDNIKLKTYSDANDRIEKLFNLLRLKYQNRLETSMKGSDFTFDSVQLMYYKCHKVNFQRGGSYINSPHWIKKEKPTTNPQMKKINVFNMKQLLH